MREAVIARVKANEAIASEVAALVRYISGEEPVDVIPACMKTVSDLCYAFVYNREVLLGVMAEYDARSEAENAAQEDAAQEMYWRNRHTPGSPRYEY